MTKALMRMYSLKSEDDYRGCKCYKLLQGLDAPCPFCTNKKLREGEIYSWEYYNKTLKKWVSASDTLTKISGQMCRVEVLYDVTEKRREITRLEDQLATGNFQLKGIQTLVQETDFEKAINQFLENCALYYQANRAYIFEFDFKKQVMSNTFEWCAPCVTREIDNLQEIPMAFVEDWVRKFEETGEFYISSLHEDLNPESPDFHILDAQGIKSLLAAPLRNDGKILGFLGIDDPKVNSDNMDLLRSAASFVLEEMEKRRLMAELERMSYTDTLTGLGNRNLYNKIMQSHDRNTLHTLGLVFVDINGLKRINDTYGHAYGDRMIVHVSELLKKNMGENVFRMGGDEFLVMCENVTKKDFE
ncbi:MAG: diguanylate cyclase, partial [Clostridia bacterium]|nr:diguanylate cyclase [Clostridia bacterium]